VRPGIRVSLFIAAERAQIEAAAALRVTVIEIHNRRVVRGAGRGAGGPGGRRIRTASAPAPGLPMNWASKSMPAMDWTT